MAKQGGDFGGDVNLGTDAWNVADGYTKLKILRQLIMFDRWDTIAQFGTEEIDEDQGYNTNQLSKRRVEGLQRLHSTIRQLLGNVAFAMKKADKPLVATMLDRVETCSGFIPKAFDIKNDQISHEDIFEINEEMFNVYSLWCEENKKPRLTKENLGRQLPKYCQYINSIKQKERIWQNARLKEDWVEKLKNSVVSGDNIDNTDTTDTIQNNMRNYSEGSNNDNNMVYIKSEKVSDVPKIKASKNNPFCKICNSPTIKKDDTFVCIDENCGGKIK